VLRSTGAALPPLFWEGSYSLVTKGLMPNALDIVFTRVWAKNLVLHMQWDQSPAQVIQKQTPAQTCMLCLGPCLCSTVVC